MDTGSLAGMAVALIIFGVVAYRMLMDKWPWE